MDPSIRRATPSDDVISHCRPKSWSEAIPQAIDFNQPYHMDSPGTKWLYRLLHTVFDGDINGEGL